MIWAGCGKWDSGADKRAWWSEEEMQLSMTLLLPLTTTHRSPFFRILVWAWNIQFSPIPGTSLPLISCLHKSRRLFKLRPSASRVPPAHSCALSRCLPPSPCLRRFQLPSPSYWKDDRNLNGENKNLTFMLPRDGTDKTTATTATKLLFL